MRDKIRAYLGIDELPSKNLIAASEKAQRDRHEELLGRFASIEQLFQAQHLKRPPTPVVPYDWDGVQTQQLAEMLANKPNEEN